MANMPTYILYHGRNTGKTEPHSRDVCFSSSIRSVYIFVLESDSRDSSHGWMRNCELWRIWRMTYLAAAVYQKTCFTSSYENSLTFVTKRVPAPGCVAPSFILGAKML